SSVNGFLRVGSGASPPTALQPGTVADALALTLENATDRRLTAQSLRIAIAGVGDDAQLLDGVSLWRDDPAQPGTRDVLLAGPVPFASDDGEVVLPLAALPALEVGATVELTVALHARSSIPAGSEFALAAVGSAAWHVTAEGAGNPQLAIEGATRITGPVLRVGDAVPFPGDADGDGQLTVADLRRLC